VASGNLDSADEPFRPKSEGSGHRVRFAFHLDPAIAQEALASLRCRRIAPEDHSSPRVDGVASVQSATQDEAKPGEMVRISGARLSFEPSDETSGVFFSPESGDETKCECYAHIQPSLVIAQIPSSLPPGDYRLVIRTRLRRGRRIEGETQITLRE
jgi:hypothetical protein